MTPYLLPVGVHRVYLTGTQYRVGIHMYPLWAMSTGRVEIEGPNGGLRTLRTRCGLSLCALSVCLITYLWWEVIKRILGAPFYPTTPRSTHQHVVVDPAVHGTDPPQRSPRISGPKGPLGPRSPFSVARALRSRRHGRQ